MKSCKQNILKKGCLLAIFASYIFLLLGCGGESGSSSGGACTVDCSLGGGDITLYSNISKDDCRKHTGSTSGHGYPCTVWYCPPTGNEDDCYILEEGEDSGDYEIIDCMFDCPLIPGFWVPDQNCIHECGGPIYKTLVTDADPPGGTYSETQDVEFVVNSNSCIPDNFGSISTYYTTDNSTPTTYSQFYTDPILIDSNTDIKFFSKFHYSGNHAFYYRCTEEDIKTESYIINE